MRTAPLDSCSSRVFYLYSTSLICVAEFRAVIPPAPGVLKGCTVLSCTAQLHKILGRSSATALSRPLLADAGGWLVCSISDYRSVLDRPPLPTCANGLTPLV